MRIEDLASNDSFGDYDDVDVCVVGSGVIGSYVASQLVKRKIKVLLVEAGESNESADIKACFEPICVRDMYGGAKQGRSFGLGGTSVKWGGVLSPHCSYDLSNSSESSQPAWENILETVEHHAESVLDDLGWSRPMDFDGFAKQKLHSDNEKYYEAGFHSTSTLTLPFKKKNFFRTLCHGTDSNYFRVIKNAVVTGWGVTSGVEDFRCESLVLESMSGRKITVRARRVVIASGALESARAVMQLNELTNQQNQFSFYLSDHLSLSIATVKPSAIPRITRMFSPYFVSGWMRTLRLREKDRPSNAPRAFLHFVFHSDSAAFRLARGLAGAVQARSLASVPWALVLPGSAGLLAYAFYRFALNRLYIPSDCRVCLQLDIEQALPTENRLRLSEELDQFGRRKLSIDWGVHQEDLAAINATAERVFNKFNSSYMWSRELEWCGSKLDIDQIYDAYHPTATCISGDHAKNPVASDMRVKGLENVWTVSTGNLPNAGSTNPTFTALCLAKKLTVDLSSGKH